MTTMKIFVWKKETNRITSRPDYTIEIEEGLIVSLITVLERIASVLEEKSQK